MKKLCAIGEALIDFIPLEKERKLKDVISFERAAGGAPANVVGAFNKLAKGGRLISQLGNDPFGDYILDVLNAYGIDTRYVLRSDTYETSLAFVSEDKDGNRDFKFYRKNAADLYFDKDDLKEEMLDDIGVLHFCSVDLVPSKMKETHLKLIEMAKNRNILISFDPNLRLNLWDDHELLKGTVNEFIDYADIVKIADDELKFITNIDDYTDAINYLLNKNIELLIITKGDKGAAIYHKNDVVEVSGIKADVVDTTGAGDSFIGAFNYCLLKDNIEDLSVLTKEQLKEYLTFANKYASIVVTRKGALSAMPTKEEMNIYE